MTIKELKQQLIETGKGIENSIKTTRANIHDAEEKLQMEKDRLQQLLGHLNYNKKVIEAIESSPEETDSTATENQ